MTDLITALPLFFHGIMITIILMLASLSIGFILAVLFTAICESELFFLKKPIQALIFFIRGTPILVQLFLIYYGAGQFDWLRASFLWPLFREPMNCAIISLSINTACYTTILLRGAIQSVPKNEVAACAAIGMSNRLAFRRIIFPRALRIALPAYSNEVLMILKGTSLASTITLLDIMGVTQQLIAKTYLTVQWYLVAGVIYLILNAMIVGTFYYLYAKTRLPTQS